MATKEIPQRAKIMLIGIVLLFVGMWRVNAMQAIEDRRTKLIHDHEVMNPDGVLWLPNGKIEITVFPDRNLLDSLELIRRMGYNVTHITAAPCQLTESARAMPMRLIANVQRQPEYHPAF